jgi:hypothetical protein
MLISTLKLYPEYDLQKPVIPPRSRLYCLEPIGVGTAYVESLTSYVARLASQHCITTRKLIITEIAPNLIRVRQGSIHQAENLSQVIGIERRRVALNGIGLMATNLVKALEALTQRNDLHFLSLLTWAQVLTNRGLLRHQSAWCPKCYQEWRDKGKSIYEPLLWSVNTAVICPYHHNRLWENCPHCHQHLVVLSGNSLPGYCNKCGQWLGSSQDKTVAKYLINEEAELNWQLHVVHNLGELLAAAPSLDFPPLRNRISQAISTYINQVSQSNKAAFSRLVGINAATMGSWCQGTVIPQIDKLLRLTRCLEISLLDFLTKELLTVDYNCLQTEISQFKNSRKSYRQLSRERKQVLNVVLQEVIKESPPPSLEEVALRLKHRPLVLQYHFPELCQEIKTRHAESRKSRREQKIKPILEAALQEFPPPSLLEITRRLGYQNNGYLYQYFPELCYSISKRYREHNHARGQEKRKRIREEIETIALTLHSQGQKPTQSKVTKLLKSPGIMLSPYARQTLDEILRSLGYE